MTAWLKKYFSSHISNILATQNALNLQLGENESINFSNIRKSMTSLEYFVEYCNRPVCTDNKCNSDTLQQDSQSKFSCLFIQYLPSKCYNPCTSIFKNKLSLMEMMGQKHRLSICLYRFSHK